MDAESEAACQRTDVPTTMQQSEAAYKRTDVPTTMQQSEAACQRTDVLTLIQHYEAACQRTDVPTTMQQSEAAYKRTDVPTTMQQSEAACQRTDVPTTMQQSEAACQRTDVPTTMQQPEAACQRTDVPTTMQQSEAACQRTDVPTTMQQSEAACQRTDVHTTMQQSEAACQRNDVPTTMQQEAPVPAPSAVTDSPQRTENKGNTGTVSGSYNPIIVGSSGVNVTYNFPLEGPGVPASRPQYSQRPDQEPRLGTRSYQDVGNKTRDILMRVYKTTGKYVHLNPGIHDDQRSISKIYTRLQIRTKDGTLEEKYTDAIVYSTDYEAIFKNRDECNRFILFGTGGVGKSTIFNMIALDWAVEANDFLKAFNLVFLLKMHALSQDNHLVDSIFDQLLGADSGIAKDELDKFIQANSNKVLILLDGFDEMMTTTLNAASFGSILKALNRTRYRDCFICVSTRPSHLETLMSETLVQNPCTHAEILGFTDEDVSEYVRKFYDEDSHSGKALIETIGKSNTLRDFASNPMLLLLMCLLWRESQQLPETTSRLFTETVHYMFTRKHISGKDGSKTVISIGQTALRGLMSANQKFSFQEDEFKPNALELALKAGILTKQRVIKNRKSHNNIQFTHKTVQEYCAAKYLQSIHISNQGFVPRRLYKLVLFGEFQNNLRQLCQTIEGVVSNEFLLRFCCGDNKECMNETVNFLERTFNKAEPKYQSDVVQAISRNCFLESQSAKVPRCLTSDTHIPSIIDVDNNSDFRSLIYLLEIICRSDSHTAQLARVKTIKVSSVSSVADLAFALGHMENLRALRLDECPLVSGNLKTILSCIKCNQLSTDLCIEGNKIFPSNLNKTVSCIKCNQLSTDLSIEGNKIFGDRATEYIQPALDTLETFSDSSVYTAIKIEITVLEKCVFLTKCPIEKGDLEEILSSLKCNQLMTNLCIKGDNNLGSRAIEWADHMKHLTSLHKLEISNCELQGTDIEHIASTVADMSSLTDLILAGNTALGGSADSWAKKLSQFTTVVTLNLSSCTLQWTDIEHIASAVGDMPRLTDLILTNNPALGESTENWSRYLLRMKQKHTLDLSNFSLTLEDFGTISVVLNHSPTLTHLNLAGNTALGETAEFWAGNLSRFTSIKILNLSNCTLQWTDIEHIASGVSYMPKLTDLILAGNTTLGGSAELSVKNFWRFTNTGPQTLDLGNCALQWSDFEHIVSAVSDIPTLTNLILAGNTAFGVTAELWAKKLSRFTKIQTLNLSNCALQWTDIKHIASAVSDRPRLTDLILTDNPALGLSTEKWSSYLLRVKQNHTLDLSNSSLTWEDVGTISIILDHIPTLTNLILAGNTSLGGSADLWGENLLRFKNINTLNLSNCTLQWTVIEHIASALGDMPRLTNLILAGNTTLGGSAELWAKNLSRFKNLQTLNLSSCALQRKDMKHIASAVRKMTNLTDFVGDNLAGELDDLRSRFSLLRVHCH